MSMATPSDAMQSLARDGYCALPCPFTPGLAPRMRALGDRLLARETSEARQALRSLGSLISVFSDAGFAELITDARLHETLRALGFSDLRFSAGYYLSKPPRSPASFWHQDWGFWGESLSYELPTPQVGLLWYLIDVDTSNGCPRFVPGSHRQRHELHDLVEQIDVAQLRRGDQLALPAYAQVPAGVSVPVRAGDVVLFDPRVLHGAHANTSAEERPAFALWFYRDYQALPAGVRAFAASGDPRCDWPPDVRAQTDHLMPEYHGHGPKAELRKFPDRRLR
jgi:phytanoyl-CoA hydroxylase